jgi:hypothetical protein
VTHNVRTIREIWFELLTGPVWVFYLFELNNEFVELFVTVLKLLVKLLLDPFRLSFEEFREEIKSLDDFTGLAFFMSSSLIDLFFFFLSDFDFSFRVELLNRSPDSDWESGSTSFPFLEFVPDSFVLFELLLLLVSFPFPGILNDVFRSGSRLLRSIFSMLLGSFCEGRSESISFWMGK